MTRRLQIYLAILAWILVIMLVNLYFMAAQAGDRIHIDIDKTINYYHPVEEVTSESITILDEDGDDIAEATAKAMAMGCPWYYGTNKVQGCVTGAYYDGEAAVNIGIGWHPDDSNTMIWGEITPDDDPDKIGYKAGALFMF